MTETAEAPPSIGFFTGLGVIVVVVLIVGAVGGFYLGGGGTVHSTTVVSSITDTKTTTSILTSIVPTTSTVTSATTITSQTVILSSVTTVVSTTSTLTSTQTVTTTSLSTTTSTSTVRSNATVTSTTFSGNLIVVSPALLLVSVPRGSFAILNVTITNYGQAGQLTITSGATIAPSGGSVSSLKFIPNPMNQDLPPGSSSASIYVIAASSAVVGYYQVTFASQTNLGFSTYVSMLVQVT